MRDYTPIIAKGDLEVGAYYRGRCRNATIARWDGTKFHHWRTKFGSTFLETIKCPEDDSVFDVFVAEEKIDVTQADREIPFKK